MSTEQRPVEHVIIAFDTVNAAFCDPFTQDPDDAYAAREVVAILTGIIRKLVESDWDLGALHDRPILDTVNGRTVGVVTITRGQA